MIDPLIGRVISFALALLLLWAAAPVRSAS